MGREVEPERSEPVIGASSGWRCGRDAIFSLHQEAGPGPAFSLEAYMTIAYRSSKAALAPWTERISVYADAMVRLAAGLFLIPHGAQKLFGLFGGPGLEGARAMFETKLGLPPWLAVVAGLIEVFGGAMLALGIATRPVALLIAAQLFFAAFVVHWHAGFVAQKGGFEYPLLWAVVALSYALKGGGHCSLDTLIFGRSAAVGRRL